MLTLEAVRTLGRKLGRVYENQPGLHTFSPEELLAFARQVEAETIERCAKVCDTEYSQNDGISCAEAIRALSSPIEQGRKENSNG